MTVQNVINRKVSDARLDTIATLANPESIKNIQLDTLGNIILADPGEGGGVGNDPDKVDETSYVSVTSSRSLVLSDRGQYLGCDSTSNITITVPKDATTNFAIGSFIEIAQINTGSVTIVQEDSNINILRYGSTSVTGHILAGQHVAGVLKKVAANEWRLYGGVDLGVSSSINEVVTASPNFSDSTPEAPAGSVNVKWQKDTNTPNNVSAYIDYGSTFLDTYRRKIILGCDFFVVTGTTSFDPFFGTAISSGTIAAANASIVTRHHPGVLQLRSSTTANSGYLIGTSNATILIGGGEVYECVVNFTTLTNTTIRLGYLDSTNITDAVDGAYFEITAASVIAKTANNSTRTPSSSLFTPSTATWYRFRISVNSNATQVNFQVFNDSGSSLGSTSNTTNIPTTAGRETGASIIATNSGTTATDLLHLDYMAISYSTPLTR